MIWNFVKIFIYYISLAVELNKRRRQRQRSRLIYEKNIVTLN